MTSEELMVRAVELSHVHMRAGSGGPFGALVACDGAVVAEGWNQVTSTNDPTAHAEVVAIRRACAALGRFDLRGCEIYTSCEPCPMCLGAIHWARLDRVWYGNDRADAAAIGFDDEMLYREIGLPLGARATPIRQLLPDHARSAFEAWAAKSDKVVY